MARAKVRTISKDRGATQIKKDLDALKASYLTVGIHSNAEPYASGTSVQFVATENEFGNARVPERSFLRSTFDENRESWRAKHNLLLNSVLKGKLTTVKALRILGFEMANAVQTKIITLQTPENAPSTVAQKPLVGNNPLINTRHLLNSVGFEVTTPRSRGKDGVKKGSKS